MQQIIVYHGGITPQGVRNFEIACTLAIREGASEITVCLCSGGGDVNAGLGAYNFLRMLPIKVNTHCFGIIGSIAVTMFLAGETRTSAEAAMFSLHAASFVEGPLKGQVSPNTRGISLPFVTQLGWSTDLVDHYFATAEEKIFDVKKAIDIGIVRKIVDMKFPVGVKVVNVNPAG